MYTKLAPSLGSRLSKQVLVIPSNIKDRNVPERVEIVLVQYFLTLGIDSLIQQIFIEYLLDTRPYSGSGLQ